MNPDSIPTEHLILYARDRAANICQRPGMYGGTWQGAEVALLCAFDLLELAESWPDPPRFRVAGKWCAASYLVTCKAFEMGNTSLSAALERAGVTDYEVFRTYLAAAADAYASVTQEGNRWVLSHDDATRIENAVRLADQHVQRVQSIGPYG